ncbi:hypothetical protein BJY04DRAFT_179990 [Aspergillus karnatakaensis]|uniref:uncharacterized protein n=1 Tax=Aspergillus karnatakaensis TaxID=1810916 RepID=UPI003CCDA444
MHTMAKQIPGELILDIVKCLIPSSPPFLFTANHVITRTLLSLMLVCKLVSGYARQLLNKHCLRLDSGRRLELFVQQGFVAANANSLPYWLNSVELFLAPFPMNNLNIPSTVNHVNLLSTIICGRLTRLIIDMPLRKLYPDDDDHNIRPILRKAFARMTNLEEFCSIRDELYLSTEKGMEEAAVWSFWPRLQRLALYNVAIESSQFIEGLCRCSNLTHLVLVRPDGLSDMVRPEHFGPGFLPSLQRLMIVDTEMGFLHSNRFSLFLRNNGTFVGRLRELRTPGTWESNAEDSDSDSESVDCYHFLRVPEDRKWYETVIYQDWLMEHAISGTLWGISDNHQTLGWSSSNSEA